MLVPREPAVKLVPCEPTVATHTKLNRIRQGQTADQQLSIQSVAASVQAKRAFKSCTVTLLPNLVSS